MRVRLSVIVLLAASVLGAGVLISHAAHGPRGAELAGHHPTVSPSGPLLPAQILGLGNFWLNLPVAAPGSLSAMTVEQPQLATFVDSPYFVANSSNTGVLFEAPVGGATTPNSSYPRSELREAIDSGTAPASWDVSSGTSTMKVTEAALHLPAVKPQVVTAQIHDGTSDVIEVVADGTRTSKAGDYALCVRHRGTTVGCLTTTYVPGTPYTIKIVAASGHIKISYDGTQVYDFADAATQCYFKAGAYTLSNPTTGDDAADYGETLISSISITHS